MKVGVIGGGTVGKAVARTYLEFVDEVRVWDIIRERSTHPVHEAMMSDIVFVCLPEKSINDFLDSVIESVKISDRGYYLHRNFVLKSTVSVGTTRRLREKYGLINLVHSPEFLTARCAETDARIPSMNVIGFPRSDSTGVDFSSLNAKQTLVDLYNARFPGTPLLVMSSDESETLKLALNSFFAVKVAFFNELYQFCEKSDIGFNGVRAGMLADGRITAHHTRVPGPDGQFGYGGDCLPKDLQTFAMCMAEVGEVPVILSAAKARNTTDRGKGV